MLQVTIAFTQEPLEGKPSPSTDERSGAVVDFLGIVRGMENGKPILGLDYEAHIPMATKELGRIMENLQKLHPCNSALLIHRLGRVAVGEASVRISVHATHRAEAFALAKELLDEMKRTVPIWKKPVILEK